MELIYICRTCDATELKNTRFHLKERVEDYPEILADMLQELAKIYLPVAIAEKLPQYMCEGCTRRLLDAHDFVAQVRDATELMMKQLIKECFQESPMEHCSVPLFGDTIVTADENPEATQSSDLADVDAILKADAMILSQTLDIEFLCDGIKQEVIEDESPVASECFQESPVEHCCEPLFGDEIVTEANDEIPDTTKGSDLAAELSANVMILKQTLDSSDAELICDGIKQESHFCDDESLNDDVPLLNVVNNRKSEKSNQLNNNSTISKKKIDNTSSDQLTDTAEKTFQCDICLKSYKTKITLRNHRYTHFMEKRFPCDFCTKKFTRNCILQVHRRRHTGEKPIKCDLCEKTFNRSSEMNVHRRTHTGERPYECDVCKMSFKTNSQMHHHQRKHHYGEKPYKCDLCEMEFTNHIFMQNHRSSHTPDRPFKCNVCELAFINISLLKLHQRIHIREKHFKCDICTQSFNKNQYLKVHRRWHTGEKPYQCDLCQNTFRTSRQKLTHKRMHHSDV